MSLYNMDCRMTAMQLTPSFFVNPQDGSEFILIPGGRFWIGSAEDDDDAYDDEKPRHLHCISPYFMSLYCVTVAQFRQFIDATEYDAGDQWQQDSDDCPVRFVNWMDAQAYCDWSNARLPYEAEWELAARGYQNFKYPWGNDWSQGRNLQWSEIATTNMTEPAKNFPQGVSPFGIFQMSGNVWEWCLDTWDDISYKRYADGNIHSTLNSGVQLRAARGGSWMEQDPRDFRGAYRSFSINQKHRYANFGFRLAKSLLE